VLQQYFEHLLPALAQIVPEVRSRFPMPLEGAPQDADAQRLRLFSAVSEVLAHVAGDQGLVLILDDLHWADDVTLQVLHFLLRQPGLVRVLILGAFRSEEVAPESALGGLVARSHSGNPTALLSLQPLPSEETRILLEEQLGGRCAEGLVGRVYERSVGNPLFAVQIARLLQQEGGIHREQGRWTLTPGAKAALPPAVRETVSRRLRHISIEGRAVLGFCALLGREFAYVALERLAELNEDALFEALDEAREAGLVRENAEGYAFAHPLLWEVVYSRMPGQRRQRLHERAGNVLESMYGDEANGHASELAWHFIEAGKRERALQYVLRAADQAEMSVAHTVAERYYRQAIDLANTLGNHQVMAQALLGLGGVMRATRQLEEAILCLDEAARMYESSGDLDAEAAAVAELGLCRYFAERDRPDGITRLNKVMERLQSRDGAHPSIALARLAAVLPRLYERSPNDELCAAQYALELGRTLNDPGVQAAGHLRLGTALIDLWRQEEALPELDRSIQLARGTGDLFTLGAACNFARRAATRSGLTARALEYALEAFDAVERRGGLEQLRGISEGCFRTAFWIGEWKLARTFIERDVVLQHQLRSDGLQPKGALCLAWLCLCEGKWDEATECLVRAEQGVQDWERVELSVVRVLQTLLQGDAGEAVVQARLLPTFDVSDWDYEVIRIQALNAALDPEAVGLASRLAATVRSKRDVIGTGESAYVLGVCLRAAGRTEESLALLREAAEIGNRVPMAYLEGRALYELGLLLASAGQSLEATEKLTTARAIFHGLGARPFEQMTIQALKTFAVSNF
jgi:predicted ATPase